MTYETSIEISVPYLTLSAMRVQINWPTNETQTEKPWMDAMAGTAMPDRKKKGIN